MRLFFQLLIFVGIAGALIFYNSAGVRETVRGWYIAKDQEERYDAYVQGKRLFAARWQGAASPDFRAWGDDSAESAEDVVGDTWVARGRFKGGVVEGIPWVILFDLNKGTAYVCTSGQTAEAATRLIQTGDYRKAMQQYSADAIAATAAAAARQPVRGAWMWKDKGPLDQRH